jgi:hypothetical protein
VGGEEDLLVRVGREGSFELRYTSFDCDRICLHGYCAAHYLKIGILVIVAFKAFYVNLSILFPEIHQAYNQ